MFISVLVFRGKEHFSFVTGNGRQTFSLKRSLNEIYNFSFECGKVVYSVEKSEVDILVARKPLSFIDYLTEFLID